MQSNPPQVLNIKGKDRQIQLNRHKKNSCKVELSKYLEIDLNALITLAWVTAERDNMNSLS